MQNKFLISSARFSQLHALTVQILILDGDFISGIQGEKWKVKGDGWNGGARGFSAVTCDCRLGENGAAFGLRVKACGDVGKKMGACGFNITVYDFLGRGGFLNFHSRAVTCSGQKSFS